MEKSLSQYADIALHYVQVSEQMSIKDCSILKLLELEKSLSSQGNMPASLVCSLDMGTDWVSV